MKPRANPPLCWLCDRRLWSPRKYVLVVAEDGREHPAHTFCAELNRRGEERVLDMMRKEP